MPRVSVIIPAHDAEQYIAEALASVRAQTYEDWEVIVADDASADRTGAIASGFGEKVKVIQTRENVGPASARNLAIAHSDAELLAFLDADDYWTPDYLAEQVVLFDSSRCHGIAVGIVACNALVRRGDRVLPRTYMDYADNWGEVTLARMLEANRIFTSAVAPREIVEEVGRFAQGMLAEDHDLWVRILERGYHAVVNPRALAVYRLTSGSASADPAAMARAAQRVNQRALDRGHLTGRERRIARRAVRRYRAVERIAAGNGASWRRAARTLPLLALVALENPGRWPSFVRTLARGNRAFDRLAV